MHSGKIRRTPRSRRHLPSPLRRPLQMGTSGKLQHPARHGTRSPDSPGVRLGRSKSAEEKSRVQEDATQAQEKVSETLNRRGRRDRREKIAKESLRSQIGRAHV